MSSSYIPHHQLKQYPSAWGGDVESRWDKKRSMPFSVGLAVSAVGAAMTAGATAGTIAMAAVSVVAAVATVSGLVMTVVGMATGDKDLMRLGGMIGLAGGIASMGVSALSASMDIAMTATEVTAQAASTAAAPAASGAEGAAGGLAESAMTDSITPAFASGAVNTGTSGASNAASTAITPAFGSTTEKAAGTLGSSLGSSASVLGDAGKLALDSSIPATVGKSTGGFLDLTKSLYENTGASSAASDPAASVGLNLKDLIQPATTIIGAIGTSNSTDDYIKMQQKTSEDALAFKKQQYDQQLASANTQGHLNMSTAPWTPNSAQLTPAQIAGHVQVDARGYPVATGTQLDANGNPMPRKPGLIARA